jgi:hypothetical protein
MAAAGTVKAMLKRAKEDTIERGRLEGRAKEMTRIVTEIGTLMMDLDNVVGDWSSYVAMNDMQRVGAVKRFYAAKDELYTILVQMQKELG